MLTGIQTGISARGGAIGMRMELDLSRHCVETELKRQHNRAVAAYFRAADEKKQHFEGIIELTRKALETLDFGRLRSCHPQLAGGSDAVIELVETGGGFVVVVDGKSLDLTSAKRPDDSTH